jgi:hypothetical protein
MPKVNDKSSPEEVAAGNPWASAEDKSGDLLQDPENTAREKPEANLGRKQAGTGSGAPQDKVGGAKGIGAAKNSPAGNHKK